MKETNLKSEEKTVIVKQAEKESKQVFLGNSKSNPHIPWWEVNLLTKKVQLAKYEVTPVVFGQKKLSPVKKKIVVNKGCKYVQALNAKNAIKKLGL